MNFPTRVVLCGLSILAVGTGCSTGKNYTEVASPRYAANRVPTGACARPSDSQGQDEIAPTRPGKSLKVVSFNVKFAVNVQGAAEVLLNTPELRCADVVLLQEMDADGASLIAERLRLSHRYYPAVFSTRTERDFGNAVLSRWPIIDDAKVVLPHHSLVSGTQRVATAATIDVEGDTVRVYSTHLGTLVEIGPGAREEQFLTIATDAERYERVIVGGDMNSRTVGYAAQDIGYEWPTEPGPPTTALGRWDHVFVKGLSTRGPSGAGTVLDVEGVSDHRPIWVVVDLDPRNDLKEHPNVRQRTLR